MELFANDHFVLTYDSNNDIYISVKEKGFEIKEFNRIIKEQPRMVVNRFTHLRKALEEATSEEIKIGHLNERIQVFISNDKMSAEVKANITHDEFSQKQAEVFAEVISALNDAGVKEGILFERIRNEFTVGKKMVIAKGIEPITGNEAVVKYYQISERKPVIREDGRADFYELQFIDQVKKGDWLGEKILPGPGTPGRTVTGEEIPSKKGKDKLFRYDKNTVITDEEENKIVLRAAVDGAVEFKNGMIMVQNHLVINGDVNTGTGNIEFDGSITINGTVNNGFTVTATNDISVLGEIGIGKVKKIHSKKGDIFIKGGVSGGNEATLEAGKNIFVKYANDCSLVAGDTINIGLYSFGSNLNAKNVLLDSKKGRIVGGKIKAEVKVVSAVIGNSSGRQTLINVAGFDRAAVMEELNVLLQNYKKILNEADQLKREIDVYEMVEVSLSMKDRKEYLYNLEKYDSAVMMIYELEQRRHLLMNYLQAKGEGQVSISQKAYPQTMLQIKAFQKKLERVTAGTFYAIGKELHFE